MRVQIFDPYYDPIEAQRRGVTVIEDLDELLRTSDFVSINTPLLQGTRGLINHQRLAAMKKTAFLINTGRGPIVDTDALVAALRDGVIAGAGLDVTDPEPLPDGHPLFDLDNAVITPHLGGNSPETFRPCAVISARLALDALHGKRPSNMINPQAWDRLRTRLGQAIVSLKRKVILSSEDRRPSPYPLPWNKGSGFRKHFALHSLPSPFMCKGEGRVRVSDPAQHVAIFPPALI